METETQKAEPSASGTDGVRDYYDKNTRSFLRFGQGRGTSTIRRSIWAPGVKRREDAFHFVDQEIARRIGLERVSKARVLDLGCGVGGSLLWLAERFDIEGTGVTLSGVQAALGRELVRQAANRHALRGQLDIVAGDVLDFRPAMLQDAAFAIESFALVPDAYRFFRQAHSVLRPQGSLIIVEDFLAAPGEPAGLGSSGAGALGPADRERIVADFKRGWRVQTLVTVEEAARAASAAGFDLVDQVDLTPYLELGRPRDILIRQLVWAMRLFPLLDRRPRLANLIGGDALQRGLTRGVFTHRLVSFRARLSPTGQ